MIRTAVVGAQPVDCEPVLQRGSLTKVRGDLAHLLSAPGGIEQLDALAGDLVQAVIAAQEALGLDILSEGETTRSDYWSYFVAGLDGTAPGANGAVRITGELAPKAGYMLSDWVRAQSFTRLPVKMTIPGPSTCARYVADEAYGSPEELSAAFARVINRHVRQLAAHGCRVIQVDDCQLAYHPDAAMQYGLDHLGACFDGIGPEVTRVVHICRGTPGFVDKYHNCGKAPEQDCYETLLSAMDPVPVDVISVEQAFCPTPLSAYKNLKTKTLMLGVIDVASREVETVDAIIATSLPFIELFGPDRLILAPDCGFSGWNRERPRGRLHHAAMAKLAALSEAARRLNGL